jgi:hypothetical protein
VATIVVNHELVAPAGDSLFPGLPAQNWRYTR